MAESQWEIELEQVRRLMRNVVTNHDRIRERVQHLEELYYDGAMGDGVASWQAWAIDRFANSSTMLRFITSPHPLTLTAAQRREQQTRESRLEQQKTFDAKRAQAGWDSYLKLWAKAGADKTGVTPRWGDDIEAVEPVKAKAKSKAQPALPIPKPLPPDPVQVDRLRACERIDRMSQLEQGKLYAAMREDVQTHRVEKNPKTGKYWTWVKYAEEYIPRSRKQINKCIALYEANKEDVTLGDITQGANVQENNIVNLPRK